MSVDWNSLEKQINTYFESAAKDKIPRIPEIVALKIESLYMDTIKNGKEQYGNSIVSLPRGFLASSLKKSFELNGEKPKLDIELPPIPTASLQLPPIPSIDLSLPNIKIPNILPDGTMIMFELPNIPNIDVEKLLKDIIPTPPSIKLDLPKIDYVSLLDGIKLNLSKLSMEEVNIAKEILSILTSLSTMLVTDLGISFLMEKLISFLSKINISIEMPDLSLPEFKMSEFVNRTRDEVNSKLKLPDVSLSDYGIDVPPKPDINFIKFNKVALLGASLTWNPSFVQMGMSTPPPGSNGVVSNKITFSGTLPPMNIDPKKQNMASEIVRVLKEQSKTISGVIIAGVGPFNIPTPFPWVGIT